MNSLYERLPVVSGMYEQKLFSQMKKWNYNTPLEKAALLFGNFASFAD